MSVAELNRLKEAREVISDALAHRDNAEELDERAEQLRVPIDYETAIRMATDDGRLEPMLEHIKTWHIKFFVIASVAVMLVPRIALGLFGQDSAVLEIVKGVTAFVWFAALIYMFVDHFKCKKENKNRDAENEIRTKENEERIVVIKATVDQLNKDRLAQSATCAAQAKAERETANRILYIDNYEKVCILPEKYWSMEAIDYMLEALRYGKADTIGEAITLYENYLHQKNMEWESKKQTAAMREMANSERRQAEAQERTASANEARANAEINRAYAEERLADAETEAANARTDAENSRQRYYEKLERNINNW